MKAPGFWYDQDNGRARTKIAALLPFSALYLAGRAVHKAFAKPYTPRVPVICVGNLVAGGAGKTPAALAVLRLVRNGRIAANPCFLTRGYGGDEDRLLARAAPVIVTANRAEGAQQAEKAGHDLIIMDDGLQNPGIAKTLRLAVIDGAAGFGNGWPLPAGPLRDTLAAGMNETDAFILIGTDIRNIRGILPKNKMLLEAGLRPPASWQPDTSRPYAAFAGIGRPEKFRQTLLDAGLRLASWQPFPDHYRYTAKDLESLRLAAEKAGARLITTEKDAVKLPPGFSCDVVPIELRWENDADAAAFIAARLKTA